MGLSAKGASHVIKLYRFVSLIQDWIDMVARVHP